MKIQPLYDKLLILPLEADNKTQSGIIIPDTAKEKPRRGTVVAFGTDEGMEIFKEGDTVAYGRYAGDEFPYDGVDYMIVCRNDILAILK